MADAHEQLKETLDVTDRIAAKARKIVTGCADAKKTPEEANLAQTIHASVAKLESYAARTRQNPGTCAFFVMTRLAVLMRIISGIMKDCDDLRMMRRTRKQLLEQGIVVDHMHVSRPSA